MEHIKGSLEKKKTVQVVIVNQLLPVVISINCHTVANIRSHLAPLEEHINDPVPILLNVLHNGAENRQKTVSLGEKCTKACLEHVTFAISVFQKR